MEETSALPRSSGQRRRSTCASSTVALSVAGISRRSLRSSPCGTGKSAILSDSHATSPSTAAERRRWISAHRRCVDERRAEGDERDRGQRYDPARA